MRNKIIYNTWMLNHGRVDTQTASLVAEEPLSIRIQGNPYAVIMRTPGEEISHVAGFCLSEGIVDSPDDFASLAVCDESNPNVVTATLKASRRACIPEHMERRGYISQTSCGICGKEVVSELYQTIESVPDGVALAWAKVRTCLDGLSANQPIREETRGAHAAAIFGSDYQLLSVAEDVGRHNALDKAIGKLFLAHTLDQAAFLLLSSRISYEMVQKAARARIPIILAKSRPTSLAVDLANRLNLTLACPGNKSGLLVFCGEHRFID